MLAVRAASILGTWHTSQTNLWWLSFGISICLPSEPTLLSNSATQTASVVTRAATTRHQETWPLLVPASCVKFPLHFLLSPLADPAAGSSWR
mmetsp:Transcript_18396/g.55483  ORF Transcript_18396/g.55483 Transcript_18396/m.55483 type:complete len:92 (-) Transcript_18396:852-1127(-)